MLERHSRSFLTHDDFWPYQGLAVDQPSGQVGDRVPTEGPVTRWEGWGGGGLQEPQVTGASESSEQDRV